MLRTHWGSRSETISDAGDTARVAWLTNPLLNRTDSWQWTFGIVVKAFDEKRHRVVANKLMNPQLPTTSCLGFQVSRPIVSRPIVSLRICDLPEVRFESE